MEEGVRLVAGDEPAVVLIATVGESFRHIPDPTAGGLGVQEVPGLSQDRQLQAARRVEDTLGDLRLALGLVIQGAMRFEEAERQADPGGESVQLADLFEDQALHLRRCRGQLAPAESLAIGISRMRADADTSGFGQA